jgi:hypothetical protein
MSVRILRAFGKVPRNGRSLAANCGQKLRIVSMVLAERSQLTIASDCLGGSGRGGVAWIEGKSRYGNRL